MSLKVSALLNPAPSPEPTPIVSEQLHSLSNTGHAVTFETQSRENGHNRYAYANIEFPLPRQISFPSTTFREQYNQASGHHDELVGEYESLEDLQVRTTVISQPLGVSLA